jgi:hypothetical protein
MGLGLGSLVLGCVVETRREVFNSENLAKQGDMEKKGRYQYCHYYPRNQSGQEVELYVK